MPDQNRYQCEEYETTMNKILRTDPFKVINGYQRYEKKHL